MIEIDGAHGEGGGQLLRTAVALSAVTGRPVRVVNVRAARRRPGLAAQHATAVRAVAALCGAEVAGAEAGSRELTFAPGPLRGGEYRFDVGTAGSVALVAQALVPAALAAPAPCRFRIAGGTDVPAAPPLDWLRHVLLPLLARMGVEVSLRCLRRGYYPRGGGEVEIAVAPARPAPLSLETPGALRGIELHAHTAALPEHVLSRMVNAARSELRQAPAIEALRLDAGAAASPGGAIVLAARTEHSVLGASALARRGVAAEALGHAAARELATELAAGAAVDLHASDQLLVYLALAAGVSAITARALTPHAATTMWLLEQLLPARFSVAAAGPLVRIACAPA